MNQECCKECVCDCSKTAAYGKAHCKDALCSCHIPAGEAIKENQKMMNNGIIYQPTSPDFIEGILNKYDEEFDYMKGGMFDMTEQFESQKTFLKDSLLRMQENEREEMIKKAEMVFWDGARGLRTQEGQYSRLAIRTDVINLIKGKV